MLMTMALVMGINIIRMIIKQMLLMMMMAMTTDDKLWTIDETWRMIMVRNDKC